MNDTQIKSINNLELSSRYFKPRINDESDPFFLEHTISSRIVYFLKFKTEISDSDIEYVISIYNEIITQALYDGSGWFDFKLRLGYFLSTFEYEAIWDDKMNKLEIKKKSIS